jgi:hypothetical protein
LHHARLLFRHEEEHLREHRGPAGARADGDASRRPREELPGAAHVLRPRLQPRGDGFGGFAGRHHRSDDQDPTVAQVSTLRIHRFPRFRVGGAMHARGGEAAVPTLLDPADGQRPVQVRDDPQARNELSGAARGQPEEVLRDQNQGLRRGLDVRDDAALRGGRRGREGPREEDVQHRVAVRGDAGRTDERREGLHADVRHRVHQGK